MFDNLSNDRCFGDSMPELNTESFIDVPVVFYHGLTSEQIRHRNQLYRVAFEKARDTVMRRSADRDWMYENGLAFGDGI
ncbi:MAG TPA: hypothetical protein VHP36_01775 [Chitinispirillaceae bacterium]|nr:hypothetical protein [Chitinispirillaceae bacterium]